MNIVFISNSILLSIIFLFGCVGEIITEKAGHLNLGIPGTMAIGSAGGVVGVCTYMDMLSSPNDANWFLLLFFALFFSILFGAIGGLIYSVLTVTFKSNQNITGLALTTFGSGIAQLIIKYVNMDTHMVKLKKASDILKTGLPFAKDLGWFGQIFLSYGILVYLGIAIAIVVDIVLNKTRIGLNLRAIGENPATADAEGINVTLYKYGAILIGSALAGIGGMFYVFEISNGGWENATTITAYGWLAIALVIFTIWNPKLAILGSIIFGIFFRMPGIITTPLIDKNFIRMIPYVITIIVLIITSIIGKKNIQAPSSLGLNYFREDR